MTALALMVALTLSILAASLTADATPAVHVRRIGFLTIYAAPAEAETRQAPISAIWQAMQELGWREGQNITVESRYAAGHMERLPELAADLVRLRVEVIITQGTVATRAAMHATTTIPIVMMVVNEPVRVGLVASLARPGGNITGLAAISDELWPKQLELLKEAVPMVSRVAVLWNPANFSHGPALKGIVVAARSLGMQPQLHEARGPDEFDSAFAAMTRARAGALLVVADTLFFLHRTRIADLAAKARLPAMYGSREHVEVGGLLAYAADYADLYRRGATYVDKILKGARPAGLPVEQPTKFELVINLKTAKALGLTIPRSVLRRADRVIE